MCGKPCYGSHTVTPGRVSNTNIVRNVPRLPNSSANYWGGQSIWTHPYWPQPAHSHRQYSPTRATTQEFLVFLRQPEPQLKRCDSVPQLKEYHMLNPYPEHNSRNTTCLTPIPSHNSKDTFRDTTQGTPASRPLRYPRSLVDHAHHSKYNTNLL